MKRFIAAQLGLMVMFLAATAYGQAPPYNENLKPLLPVIGEWTGEVTLGHDMAGMGKKGDTLSVMVVYKWTKNENAIVLYVDTKLGGEWVNVTNGLIVWDALNKKIVGLDAYRDGGIFQYEVRAEKDKIVLFGHGATADGVPTETTIEYTKLSKDSFTGQFINQKQGDKDLPDGPPFTFTRVKK